MIMSNECNEEEKRQTTNDNDMIILWIVLAFVAGSVFGAVTMSLLAAGGQGRRSR